jgi:CubicO group peptidase (beta-lactamase class C family)
MTAPPLLALAALVIQSQEPAVDSLMAAYARPDAPGAAVLVVRDGQVALAKGYGLADVESRAPVRPETSFRLASLSKHVTATAVMLLAADGKLAYDDAIGARLPELPPWARAVTVRQLLHHTSGLPDYEDFVPAAQTRQVLDADVPALIARGDGAYFAPGTRFRYSNSGYALLALLVERASGRRYADFLRERLFAPLGMAGTLAREDGGPAVPHRAFGYVVDSAGVRRRDQSSTSAVLGDGGVYASVADLARWDAALERHALVSAEAQRLAWTPPTLAPPQASSYGFGWFVDRDRGLLRLTHHGETSGFTNAVLRYPERRLAVWVLTNRAGGAPWDLAQRIAELYLVR